MSKFLNSFRSMRNRALARRELDLLSAHQLRDLNLERVMVVDSSIYRHRVWNQV